MLKTYEFSVDPKQLKAVLLAASKQDVRFYLNGVCFGPDYMVATDGHRLHVAEKLNHELPRDVILPSDFCRSIAKAKHNVLVTISMDSESTTKNATASATLLNIGTITVPEIDGKYPDWRRVLPDEVPPSSGTVDDVCFLMPEFWQDAVDACRLVGKGHMPLRAQQRGKRGVFFQSTGDDLRGIIMPVRL